MLDTDSFDSDKSADRNLVADTLAAASSAVDKPAVASLVADKLVAGTQAVGTSAADKPVGNTADRPAAGRVEKQANCYIESKHSRHCR